MSINYELLNKQIDALLGDDTDFLTNTSQFSAFIFNEIPGLNWAGFYFYKNDVLKLGPFQGKVACTIIPLQKGVCGASFTQEKTFRVDDVYEFAGHIACDAASRSEMVIPLIFDGKCVGVFDIDSPKTSRFSEDDQKGLELLVKSFLFKTKLPKSFDF